MLHYDTIDVSEGIDFNKTIASKECDVCHCWYFLNFCFKFERNFCSRRHVLLLISVNFSGIAILNIKDSGYYSIIN